MAISLPIFNCFGNVWSLGNVPSSGPPDFANVACQFYVPSRGLFDVEPGELELWVPPVYVRTPVAAFVAWEAAGFWEIPPGTGRFFSVRWKEIVHMNFPNEYHTTIVEQCDEDGNPIQRDCNPPTPPSGHNAAATGLLGGDITSVAAAERITPPETHNGSASGEISVDVSGQGEAEKSGAAHSAAGSGTITVDADGEGAAERN